MAYGGFLLMDAYDILSKFGIALERAKPYKNGSEILALCPFHEETTPSFSLNVENLCYICFGCGAKGLIWDVVEAYTNLSAKEAREACKDDLPEFQYGVFCISPENIHFRN